VHISAVNAREALLVQCSVSLEARLPILPAEGCPAEGCQTIRRRRGVGTSPLNLPRAILDFSIADVFIVDSFR
jgi:hypothetical protein